MNAVIGDIWIATIPVLKKTERYVKNYIKSQETV